MNKIKEFIKENKKKVIILLILLVILIVVLILSSSRSKDNNNDKNKVFKDSNYVITYEKVGSSELPYVNLNGEDASKVNYDMMKLYYEGLELDDKFMNYEAYNNDNILSLVVKNYIKDSDLIYSDMYFYNFDINSGTLISDDELKDIFNVTDTDIKNEIDNSIREYYDYEVKKNYVDENLCDWNCYQGYYNNVTDINFYVKDNHLYAYLYFNLDSDFIYDSGKPFDLFRFKIK